MAHTANYETIYSTADNGLIHEEIATALERFGVGDLGQLCADKRYESGQLVDAGKVNRWSAHKPVRLSSYERVTDQKFAELGYGLTMNKRLLSALISSYNGFIWDYERPVAPYFRLLDFDGYKKGATPPGIYFAVPYLRTNTESSVSFQYTGDGSDIQVTGMSTKVTDQASAASQPLSSWNVVFLIYIPGHNLQLYNTGYTLSQFAIQRNFSIRRAIQTDDLGKTAHVMACLAYATSEMTTGLHEVTGSFMSHSYVVPLNFDDTYAAVKDVVITQYEWLPGAFINYGEYRPATTLHNYYALTDLAVTATGNNTGSDTITFQAQLYLMRNGVRYNSVGLVAPTITNTRTTPPYLWEFPLTATGEINFGSYFYRQSVNVVPQAGDTLYVEVVVEPGAPGEELQIITRKIQDI